MLLECIKNFGNFKVGDEVEVPKGAIFDKNYFRPVNVPGNQEKDDAE